MKATVTKFCCWSVKKHPTTTHIEICDKSFFTLPKSKDIIPLPEYRLLTKGKTWYEEYLGAVPDNERLHSSI